ncbi:iron chelate uptake ABC transporter family permease subunit [Kineosporia sp. J2-2]|uniref:Iron chelate uptake ABC transporter family permease subunit n=1 Tax=Kineosporia corallincola TaxID=2835133 RepID=A0ABS5TK85_9ACTN|nr:iron chelate uptake ABC transporter family permease subunit [Kineosporia corallincola]MBT0771512.1 iron chelate uptake ABC transporter family permease subunit [Kineosporia corallincola]
MSVVPGVHDIRVLGLTVRVHRRSLITVLVLLAIAALVLTATVATGAYEITRIRLLHTLLGGGSDMDRFIVLRQRLPRAVAAVLVGAALGLSGAIFQSVSRNPLGSPDVVGFATGSAAGGLVVILLADTSSMPAIATGTVVGGFATAIFVYLLSRGGSRLILTGVAVGAMLSSVNDYLVTRATLDDAETARAWQFGSLNTIAWPQVAPVLLALVVLVPLTLTLAAPMRMLELGDDAAGALGVEVGRSRILLLCAGVALAGVAVATSGPIGFLAMAAPQLARQVARSPGIAMLPSAATGAVLLGAGDLLAGRLLSPFQIPVGLVTAALGGAYLLWILSWRRP